MARAHAVDDDSNGDNVKDNDVDDNSNVAKDEHNDAYADDKNAAYNASFAHIITMITKCLL